ncbi:hypothetical protein PAAG_03348 [Paracoccidioides lutzii Pb01]|uniref:DNA replication checkpoint mediator MRC1 domain-containing protein n=1 Tax=Paracoccidioides lutzii (strain ATCC MYA-826 / Pb01) TaxID=502779 RepID=C1GWX4_PARBA|nr:hypothetical protein PAAG_03348 [Paracoccidioides lutzii Pb01]EEH41062.1 hypothetical protein PAAG_03348 [Paracoccidioides lutzii Pb01]
MDMSPARRPTTPEHRDASSQNDDGDGDGDGDGNGREGSPVILTPGAKIRALVAAYDMDSDEDANTSANTETSNKKLGGEEPEVMKNKKVPVSRPLFTTMAADRAWVAGKGERAGSAGHMDHEEEEEEDEDEAPVRPKGKMAARMQAAAAAAAAADRSSSRGGRVDGLVLKGMGNGDRAAVSKNVNRDENMGADGDATMSTSTRKTSPVLESRSHSHFPLFVAQGSPKLNANEATQDTTDTTDDELPTTRGRRRNSRSIASNRSFSPLFVPQDSPVTKKNDKLVDGMETDDDADADADADDVDVDDNAPASSTAHNRLLALVEKKRKEREAREQLEAEKKAARLQRSSDLHEKLFSSDQVIDDGDDDADDDDLEAARKLTQHSRPSARKASKKALLEMNRETQRISRNMQLAHQAVTRKKITVDSFLERFRKNSAGTAPAGVVAPAPASSSVPASSDNEGQRRQSTPPSSPVEEESALGDEPADPAVEDTNTHKEVNVTNHEDLELPSVEDIFAGTARVVANAPPNPAPKLSSKPPSIAPATAPKSSKPARPAVRVRLSRQSIEENQKNDSDSDLEIITCPAKTRRTAVFENLPARNNQSSSSSTLLKLRTLAQLTSPSKMKQRSMTQGELEENLIRRARMQALREREEKIEDLKRKGVWVESAEERGKVEEEVEDLLEKARGEAREIARREKKEGKKKGEGDQDVVDLDDSEDEDYEGEEEEEEQVELSGSDEEDEDEEGEREGKGEGEEEESEDGDVRTEKGDEGTGQFIHKEADEAMISDDERSESEEPQVQGTDENAPRRKRRRVIMDDEDDDVDDLNENEPKNTLPKPHETPIRSQHSQPLFPHLPTTGHPLMGLTQAFGATFANSQDDQYSDGQEDSLALLRRMSNSERPVDELLERDFQQDIIRDSQGSGAVSDSLPLDIFASYPVASEDRVSESPAARTVASYSYSQAPEPTQDAGFVYSPFDQGRRFKDVPFSTVETVAVGGGGGNDMSPVARRGKGKLRRGPAAEFSDVEEEDGEDDDDDDDDGFLGKRSAFDVMRKASLGKSAKAKAKTPFDKTKSKAREVIDDVAEESEDEYAGLGGASDESDGEEDEIDLSMINDEGGEVVDEKQLAALNATHSRQQDEQQVNKLMRDITTGALGRRRGAATDDLDLSDSDDERIAARRRAKRREFAKMRKALLADEKIGMIAEDPKKSAFLRTIEDRDVDSDTPMAEFLGGDDDGDGTSSQNTPEQDVVMAGQLEGLENRHLAATNNNNNRKRPLDQSAHDAVNRRPPPHLRRKAGGVTIKKPSTLAEIRESVSFLLEGDEPNESEPLTGDILLSDEERPEEVRRAREGTTDEGQDDELETHLFSNGCGDGNGGSDRASSSSSGRGSGSTHSNPRRRRPRGKVVDRLSLRRQASSNAASTSTSTTPSTSTSGPRQAFFSTTTTSVPAFTRPPPLIHRATSNLSVSSVTTAESGVSVVTTGYSVSVTEGGCGGGGKKGSVNYYAAARERQRQWEVRRGERTRAGGKGGGKVVEGVLGGLLGGGEWE